VITGPLTPPPATARRPWRDQAATAEASGRLLTTLGIVLIAVGILGAVAWGIFLSPYGFSRFPLSAQYRSFDAHQPGTYVVYLEQAGVSHPTLPPALDIEVTGLAGQRVTVTMLGQPGVPSAPDAYRVGSHEGRAVALVKLQHAGTFLLTVTAKPIGQFDPTQYLPVTEGTIAVGRGFGRGWPTTQWCGLALLVLPALAGTAAIVAGRRRRAGAVAALR
jgi:hypothetical protein